MKRTVMGSRLTIVCLSLALVLALSAVGRSQQNPYRLKQPNQRQLCLSCHEDFGQKLAKRFVHTAVRSGECAACHDPHVSSHGKLLAGEGGRICAGCHEDVVPSGAKSVHAVVASGECAKCHDPHASDNAANLIAAGNELCVTCHAELGAAITKARFKHAPLEKGCVSCHDPHASDRAIRLLKGENPGLCLTCHKAESPAFVERHMKYPVGKASCTSCHDPHGSDQPALLHASVHAPVSNRACSQCHEAPDSPTPFATRRPGYELCKGCHNDMVTATLAKARLHWPVAGMQGCVSCHNPHASRHAKLVKAETRNLCTGCHPDTGKRMAAVAVKHEPVESGACTACHSPHGAEGTNLIDQSSVIPVCTTCHDYEKHSAHPIGEEAVDPRNRNLRVDCLSCHKAHGTEFKHMLLNATNTELCTQCHRQFAR